MVTRSQERTANHPRSGSSFLFKDGLLHFKTVAFFNWCLMVSCGWNFILCVDMVPVSLQSLKAGPDLSLLNGWRLTIIFSPLLDKDI